MKKRCGKMWKYKRQTAQFSKSHKSLWGAQCLPVSQEAFQCQADLTWCIFIYISRASTSSQCVLVVVSGNLWLPPGRVQVLNRADKFPWFCQVVSALLRTRMQPQGRILPAPRCSGSLALYRRGAIEPCHAKQKKYKLPHKTVSAIWQWRAKLRTRRVKEFFWNSLGLG